MPQNTITELMRCVDMHSLQYLASLRVAMSVCQSEDVQDTIRSFHTRDGNSSTVAFSDAQWQRLCGEVKQKLNRIDVPDLIIEIVLGNLWPIGFQIYKWSFYHKENLDNDCSTNFCWTPKFTIDYEKSAEIVVENEAIDIKKRFEFACFYCLDDKVRFLWDMMSLSERRCFFVRGNLKQSNLNPIVLYWSYYIQEVPTDYWDCRALNHTRLFIYAVENGYRSATKFFLGKLELNTRQEMILKCLNTHLYHFCKSKCIVKSQLYVACFLACQLPSDTLQLTFYHNHSLAFHYFLAPLLFEWPLQKHFMTIVNRYRSFFSHDMFVDLLEGIFAKIKGNFQDYDYKKLFMEFWHQCPDQIKAFVREESFGYKMFMKFVEMHFGFIFEECSLLIKTEFTNFLFQVEGSRNFSRGNVEFFKFLIRERVVTRSSIRKFSIFASSTDFAEYLIEIISGNIV